MRDLDFVDRLLRNNGNLVKCTFIREHNNELFSKLLTELKEIITKHKPIDCSNADYRILEPTTSGYYVYRTKLEQEIIDKEITEKIDSYFIFQPEHDRYIINPKLLSSN